LLFALTPNAALALLVALAVAWTASASGAAAQDVDADRVLFEADSLGRETEDGPIIAEGDVTAYFGAQRLTADRVVYDPATEIVTAEGEVSVTTDQGNVFYSERVELTGDLKDGIATSFRALLTDDARLAAQFAVRRRGAVNELKRAVYSACQVCEDGRPQTPTWRLRAFRVTQNEQRKTISYRHMFFDIKGVPVLYVPYFQQPDPSVERQSGFLTPNAGNNTQLGAFVEIPYYFALSSTYDMTIAPFYTSNDGILWKGEWRQRFGFGDYIFQGGIISTEQRDSNNEPVGETVERWHIFGEGDVQLSERWAAGFDLARTSDDTYIRRYEIERQGDLRRDESVLAADRLTTNAEARRVTDRARLDIDSFFFQGLRQEDDEGLTPYVLPLVSYVRDVAPPVLGGRGEVRANLLSLQRSEGVDTRRISVAGAWSRSRTTRSGQLLTGFAELRADVYHTEDLNEGTELAAPVPDDDTNTQVRTLPTIGAQWSWPFVRRAGASRQVIEPVAQVVISTIGGNPDLIFNEDSQSLEFDTASLFRANKFPGLDRWEDGQRANLGMRFASIWENGVRLDAVVGQTFRLQQESPFGPETGLDGRTSDIVGSVDLSLGRTLGIVNRFRLDEASGSIRRNETDITLRAWRISGRVSYLRLEDEEAATGIETREELRGAGNFRLSPNWYMTYDWREDLVENQTIQNSFGLLYRDNCASFQVSYRRDFTRDRDIAPNTAILFAFQLRTLGDFGLGPN